MILLRRIRSAVKTLLASVSVLVAVTACDIHEYPVVAGSFTLHLDFDTEMPLYKEMEVETRGTNLYSPSSTDLYDHDIRYTVEVYSIGEGRQSSREAIRRIVTSKYAPLSHNHDMEIALEPGNYRFIVWADYVRSGSVENLFYDASDFAEVKLTGEHSGSNDMRDAFRGSVDYRFGGRDGEQVSVAMSRPMAKYSFVATDLDEFVSRVLSAMNKKAQAMGQPVSDTRVVDLDEFKVVFRYTGFMPDSYNLYTGKPADSSTGVFFESSMAKLNADEAQLGFDYVFVNGSEALAQVAIETYNGDGELMSRSKTINIPLMRSKHTVIKGTFLTQIASGSVGINPDFDGPDYNIEIK